MSDNPEDAPRFRNKPIEVSLFENHDDVGYDPVFEGQTSSVSKKGVGVRVNPLGSYRSQKLEDFQELEGETFVIQFHAAGRDIPNARGTVEMVGESHDMRYKVYLGFVFEEDLPLYKLIS